RPPRPPLFPYTTLFRSLEAIGYQVSRSGGDVTVAPNGTVQPRVPEAFTGLNRIPILMIGPLLHRTGEAFVPLVGGDPIGRRPVEDRKSTRLNSSHDQIS